MAFFRAGSSLVPSLARPSLGSTSTSFSFHGFHSSASRLAESQKQRAARLTRKTNIERRAERAQLAAQNRPHVVLGTRPGPEGDTKWETCDLRKVIVTDAELRALSPSQAMETFKGEGLANLGFEAPKFASYGLGSANGGREETEGRRLFFEHLPEASYDLEIAALDVSQRSIGAMMASKEPSTNEEVEEFRKVNSKAKEEQKKELQFAKLVDLRNANAKGIAFENRRRIVQAFSPSGNATDSGHPEVQVALLTLKIRNIWSHLMQRKKDVHGRRSIRLLIHQRAKMLKYIKRLDRDRYDRILERVALEPEAVEGELVV